MAEDNADRYQAKTGIVVVLDALGIRNLSIAESIGFLETRDLLLRTLTGLGEWACEARRAMCDDVEEYGVIQEHTVMTFGDTIIVSWELPESSIVGIDLWLVSRWLNDLMFVAMLDGVALRGAVSVGKYLSDLNTNTIVGPALTDAVAWSERGDWLGVVATPSCGLHLDSAASLEVLDPFANIAFCKYVMPVNGETSERWVLSWPVMFLERSKYMKSSGEAQLLEILKEFPIPYGTEKKYDNTLRFFRWYRDEMYPSLEPQFTSAFSGWRQPSRGSDV